MAQWLRAFAVLCNDGPGLVPSTRVVAHYSPLTLVAENLMPSSSLCGLKHAPGAHTHADTHTQFYLKSVIPHRQIRTKSFRFCGLP